METVFVFDHWFRYSKASDQEMYIIDPQQYLLPGKSLLYWKSPKNKISPGLFCRVYQSNEKIEKYSGLQF